MGSASGKKKSSGNPALAPGEDRSDAAGASTNALIESELSTGTEPVLGLYLHVAYMMFMSTFEEMVGHREIAPNVIGALAIVVQRPGLSQAELARIIGRKRVTVGATVARAIESGFVKRIPSGSDRRQYALYITARGEQMLQDLRRRIREHERQSAARLSPVERVQLRSLLDKLVYG